MWCVSIGLFRPPCSSRRHLNGCVRRSARSCALFGSECWHVSKHRSLAHIHRHVLLDALDGLSTVKAGTLVMHTLMHAPRRLLTGMVLLYRWTLKPWLGNACRFEPSCSQYALDALQHHGALAGSGLTVWRLMRCHPWCDGGCDPVPTQRPRLFAHLGLPTRGGLVPADVPADAGTAATASRHAAAAVPVVETSTRSESGGEPLSGRAGVSSSFYSSSKPPLS